MLVLALVYVPVFVVGYLQGVPPDIRVLARLAGLLIVVAFAAELLAKVADAQNRIAYLRTHWLDVVVVFVPFLRPLRLLRVLPFLAKGTVGLRKVLGLYTGAYVLFVGTVAIATSAFLVLDFERGRGGRIQSFDVALWWAAETVTTVGYGDFVPVTTGGRVVAGFLMVIGITLFGILTAGVVAYFVHGPAQGERDGSTAEILARFDFLEARLESLEVRLGKRDGKQGDDHRSPGTAVGQQSPASSETRPKA